MTGPEIDPTDVAYYFSGDAGTVLIGGAGDVVSLPPGTAFEPFGPGVAYVPGPLGPGDTLTSPADNRSIGEDALAVGPAAPVRPADAEDLARSVGPGALDPVDPNSL